MKTQQDIFNYLMDRIKIHEQEINELLKEKDTVNTNTIIAVNSELLLIARELHNSIYS